MGLVDGPFPQVSFCGASVVSFSSSIGWNQESSTVTVNLVEDPLLRQRFTRPEMGTPQKFVYEKFEFQGIVQRWLEKNGTDGKPQFEIILTDPREILAGSQIILSSYRGEVGDFANLLNAFGFWEDKLGFGGALTNESGMVWNAPFDILGLTPDGTGSGSITVNRIGPVGIMPAIHSMTKAGNKFGGPLKFRGHEYSVDLSSLPIPPSYYRMGGVAASILDMVSEICQDGGHDFICTLDGHTIGFKTVSRVSQPDPGQIANFINGKDDVISNSLGLELRNDIANAIVIGGDMSQLIQEFNVAQDDTIWPFWGFDLDGSVIVGHGKPEEDHQFHLNASPIVDIVGSVQYPCDIVELRCALIDFDSWAYYVLKWWPDKAEVINLISAVDNQSDLISLFPDTIFTRDLVNDTDEAIALYGPMNDNDYWTSRAQRVYEFVRQYATDFFGRKFLVKIPFLIYYKTEPETTHIVKSAEPTDAAYQGEGSLPLGLQFSNESLFMAPDGRFQCFVKYSNAMKADIQKLPPDSIVIQDKDIYMKASVDLDVGVVYPGGSVFPYCVVTVDSPVYEAAHDPLGNIIEVAALLDFTNIDELRLYAAGLRHDSFPLKIHPSIYRPDAVAIPTKSNRDSYGPWFTSGGVDGKVSFERDEGLVPWNYGDYHTMELAALAKLTNAATSMQFIETGTVDRAGSPEHSLGEEMVSGGPQLTGIDVSIGANGVTTTYRMQTFTPRFGQFTKDNADRLRRLGIAASDMRRAVRNLYQRNLSINNILASAHMGFMANTSRAVRQQTPHQCLLATMSHDRVWEYRTQVSSMTASEALANCRGDNKDLWPKTALMTLEGLLRPFSTNRSRDHTDPLNDMPHYATVTNEGIPIARPEFDPFGENHDVDYMAWGDKYPGRIHRLKKTKQQVKDEENLAEPTRTRNGDVENSRLIGLRGPLVIVGWGYTYTGKPVPNVDDTPDEELSEHEWNDTFIENHRMHSEEWKAGPLGLHWDNWRKIWTIPTFLFGVLDDDYGTDPSGALMTIKFDTGTPGDKVRVYNYLGDSSSLLKDSKIIAAYDQHSNTWKIISAQCRD